MVFDLDGAIQKLTKYKFLITDDDINSFNLVREILNSKPLKKYTKNIVYNSRYSDTIEYVDEINDCNPYFVLIDLKLNERDVDGFDLAEDLHRKNPSIPLIAFSQMSATRLECKGKKIDLENLQDFGFCGYVDKNKLDSLEYLINVIMGAIVSCENTFFGFRINMSNRNANILHISPERISLNEIKDSTPSELGTIFRRILNLDEIDHGEDIILIDISPDFGTLPSSFFSELFEKSAKHLGGIENVRKKYRVASNSSNLKKIESLSYDKD